MFGGIINIVKEFDEYGGLSERRLKGRSANFRGGCCGVSSRGGIRIRSHDAVSIFRTTKDSAETSAFDSFTAIDYDACFVAIRSINPNSSWGYEIQVALENKSSGKIYMFAVEIASINGVETDTFFATEVSPRKKASRFIHFSDLSEYGIVDYMNIELRFRGYNVDDWIEEPIAAESIHISLWRG